MKKQKGISFIEINVSIVLFLIVAVCIIGMLANCTLWVRKTTELRQCIHLAQWKMAETQYMSETDIREDSDKFPAPFNNYKWQIQKLTPADPRLEGFTEIKVTAIGMTTGVKHSLVILKSKASILPRGTCLFFAWKGFDSSLWIKQPEKTPEQITDWLRGREQEINQATWSRDGKYIFIHKNGHLYKLEAKNVNNSEYMNDSGRWDELDTGVWTWFQASPTKDEIVYVKQEDSDFKCIVKNYKTGVPTIIYQKEAFDKSSWDFTPQGSIRHEVVCPVSVANPVFSPDGNKIALCFQSQSYDGSSGIYKLKVQIGYYDRENTFSDGIGPDKRIKILHTYKDENGKEEIERAKYQDFYFCKPAWSPDGQKLSYAFFDWHIEKTQDVFSSIINKKHENYLYTININNPITSRRVIHSAKSGQFVDHAYGNVFHGNRSVWIDNNKVAYTRLFPMTYSGGPDDGDPFLTVKTAGGDLIFEKSLIHQNGRIPYDISPYYNGQVIESLEYYNEDIYFNLGFRGEHGFWKIKADGTEGSELIWGYSPDKPLPSHGSLYYPFLQSILK